MTVDVDLELVIRAYSQGFAIGANPLKRASGHTVDSSTHDHWRRGFEDGRAAADAASEAYRKKLSSKVG